VESSGAPPERKGRRPHETPRRDCASAEAENEGKNDAENQKPGSDLRKDQLGIEQATVIGVRCRAGRERHRDTGCGAQQRNEGGFDDDGKKHYAATYPHETHHCHVVPPLFDFEQHDAQEKNCASDHSDQRDGAVKPTHYQKSLRGFRRDLVRLESAESECDLIQLLGTSAWVRAGLNANAESIHPILRSQQAGQVGQMKPDMEVRSDDPGGIPSRLVNGSDNGWR